MKKLIFLLTVVLIGLWSITQGQVLKQIDLNIGSTTTSTSTDLTELNAFAASDSQKINNLRKAAEADTGNYNDAYNHSQTISGNPHSVTPAELNLEIGSDVQAYSANMDTDNTDDVTDSDVATTYKFPLPEHVDLTGIVNAPDSVVVKNESATLTEEGEYLRTYGSGSAADTIKVLVRHTYLIKGSADSAFVLARSDSAGAGIKMLFTVKDIAGNTYASGTITPTVDNIWSRAAFALLLPMEAEEVVITYTIITTTARYLDVSALRFKEAG